MKTLKELQETPIHGNAFHDRHLLRGLDEFLLATANPMEERFKALLLLEKVMELDHDKNLECMSIEEQVNIYCTLREE